MDTNQSRNYSRPFAVLENRTLLISREWTLWTRIKAQIIHVYSGLFVVLFISRFVRGSVNDESGKRSAAHQPGGVQFARLGHRVPTHVQR